MLDFIKVWERHPKKGITEVYPKFIAPTYKPSEDLMTRGGDFYAVWNEDEHMWSTSQELALYLIDQELQAYANKLSETTDDVVRILYMWDTENGMIDRWRKYVTKQLTSCYHELDETLIFSDTETTKTDYATKRLPYPLKEGSHAAYDELMNVLYSPEERRKIEWAIGAIVNGDSKTIQKFVVMYGSAGTGKSTVLNIIQDLFTGYYSVFDAKALGSSTNAFALESFKSNPLVAIQHDGDLSRIEDNTRLNSVVSHEEMTVNEKFKSTYSARFKCFLFMGTNRPVKITDAKSGILRRLIDVSPTGNKLDRKRYNELTRQIKFELGAIAYHCKNVYESDPSYYDAYVPTSMLGASNDFYNFVLDSYDIFEQENGTSLKAAYEMYKKYCEDANVSYPYSRRNFQEELKNYFEDFEERYRMDDDVRVRNYYKGFIKDKFVTPEEEGATPEEAPPPWLIFEKQASLFDELAKDFPAQNAKFDVNGKDSPEHRWSNNQLTLKDIDTSNLHYVKVPLEHIVVDFDIPDESGEKSFDLNYEAALKWPPTYAELSKSGKGIHLHYIYAGDPTQLSSVYAPNIEVKVYSGNSSLRRKLSLCNALAVSVISSNLPLKGGRKKVIDETIISDEKHLRATIAKALRKEINGCANTSCAIDFISKVLDDAYNSGMHYDVRDLKQSVKTFAMHSTNQSERCCKVVTKMHFYSADLDAVRTLPAKRNEIVFFDVEVFPNVNIVCWKLQGKDNPVIKWINPTPQQIESILEYRLIGFNNRKYDNHILMGLLRGYTPKQCYNLSTDMIQRKTGFISTAYGISETDIYDFAATKQSLKKWEIELGIHHQELGLEWDKDAPQELWEIVADYCVNDVIATEAVFDHLQGDWTARQILAELTGLTNNDTTNTLTTALIFGGNKKPSLVYTDLATGESYQDGRKLPDVKKSNAFTGYQYAKVIEHRATEERPAWTEVVPVEYSYRGADAHNLYRGYDVGKGGFVYAEPGMYGRTVTLDVASLHPHSIVELGYFGEWTQNYKDLIDIRVAIKHKDFDKARKMFGGKLAPYLDDPKKAKQLAQALKIALNSCYGLTSASFENAMYHRMNGNNIVALRGALFMIDILEMVKAEGYKVAHVKTDSIKIVEPDDRILNMVIEKGKEYGYNFEIEHIFDRICLVNDAVYIGKCAEDDPETPGEWTATGTQFAVPYVFKTLFTHEPVAFEDMCETKSVTSALYLDMNEDLPDVSEEEANLTKMEKRLLALKIKDPTAPAIEDVQNTIDILKDIIPNGHNYRFVGKVGQFCPIRQGEGGGILLRQNGSAWANAVGTSGYRWLESETVKELNKEESIDISYYAKLVDDAKEAIGKYGDFNDFVS